VVERAAAAGDEGAQHALALHLQLDRVRVSFDHLETTIRSGFNRTDAGLAQLERAMTPRRRWWWPFNG
jgi:hypothetical protein